MAETQYHESILPVWQLRAGDEIKHKGEWLEVQVVGLQKVNEQLVIKAYSDKQNRVLTFVSEAEFERRARQPIQLLETEEQAA